MEGYINYPSGYDVVLDQCDYTEDYIEVVQVRSYCDGKDLRFGDGMQNRLEPKANA